MSIGVAKVERRLHVLRLRRMLLAIEDPGEARAAAAKLAADIPGLMPDDPELADALEREIAEAFAEGASEGGTAENARGGNPDNRGQFSKAEGPHGESEADSGKAATPATEEQVAAFLKDLPPKITAEEFDSLLTAGFTDADGAGNTMKYGTLLRDHWTKDGHSANDIEARRSKLGIAVRMIRESKPMRSDNPNRPNERIYFGLVDGKAYLAVADEHNKIGVL